jgi:hypothetical protein
MPLVPKSLSAAPNLDTCSHGSAIEQALAVHLMQADRRQPERGQGCALKACFCSRRDSDTTGTTVAGFVDYLNTRKDRGQPRQAQFWLRLPNSLDTLDHLFRESWGRSQQGQWPGKLLRPSPDLVDRELSKCKPLIVELLIGLRAEIVQR